MSYLRECTYAYTRVNGPTATLTNSGAYLKSSHKKVMRIAEYRTKLLKNLNSDLISIVNISYPHTIPTLKKNRITCHMKSNWKTFLLQIDMSITKKSKSRIRQEFIPSQNKHLAANQA